MGKGSGAVTVKVQCNAMQCSVLWGWERQRVANAKKTQDIELRGALGKEGGPGCRRWEEEYNEFDRRV